MDKRLEVILDAAIGDMRDGKTLEQVLADYSVHADELKPLLQVAMRLEKLGEIEPSEVGLSSTLIRIGQETARNRRKSASNTNWLPRLPRLAWAAAATLMLVISFSAVSSLSASSIPGDLLYPIKVMTEKVRFLLTFSSDNKAELRLTFSEERLNELIRLSQQSGMVDTTLIKAMLREAESALEGANPSADQSVSFLSRVEHTNAYQRDMLEQIRPNIDSSGREYIDRAIEICGNRGRWLQETLAREREQSRSVPPNSRETRQSTERRWNWDSGCSCD